MQKSDCQIFCTDGVPCRLRAQCPDRCPVCLECYTANNGCHPGKTAGTPDAPAIRPEHNTASGIVEMEDDKIEELERMHATSMADAMLAMAQALKANVALIEAYKADRAA